MRKLLLPFLVVFLIFWLFGGAWWFAQQHPTPLQQPSKTPSIAPSFSFVDDDFSFEVNEDISFLQSSYDAFIPEPVNNALFQLVEHLNQSKQKTLTITGACTPSELNNSAFKNLGKARAEALKSRLIRLGFEGNRVVTRGIKVRQLNFQEGVVHGIISMQVDQP